MRAWIGWSITFALGGALGCGGSNPEPEAPAPSAAEAEEKHADVPEKWTAELTHEQKAEFMEHKVVPAMTKVFQEIDAEKFATVDCKTCHGPEFKAKPSAFLSGLTFEGGKFTDDPEMVKAMMEKVLPAMVATLGVEPMNHETHEGFGCNGCHTVTVK